MATYYLKNTSGATVSVADLGLRITANNSITIDSNAINGYLTPDMASRISSSSLILSTTDIGDSSGDLSSSDAIDALTLVSGGMKNNPTGVTLSQASEADPLTDITATELEALTDGSDTTLHTHDSRYYTKTLLGSANAGTVSIDWANIINTPSFGSNIWIEPVECNLHGIDSTPPINPQEGWFYFNNGDNTLYKYESSVWSSLGVPAVGTRFIFRDGTGSNDYIYTFNGTALDAGIAPVDNWTTLVKDDGDGKCAQYVYTNDELPPDWIKIADVNWGDHNILSNRNALDSHPASAISYLNVDSGLTANNSQDAIDEIADSLSTIDSSTASHIANVNNPHTTTLEQTIASDVNTDKINLTISNINSLVSGNNITLHSHIADIIDYDSTASELTSLTVQDAIDELDSIIDTLSSNSSSHISSTTNPHNTTLAQAILADQDTDKINLTIANINELVGGLETDLHLHNSSDITFDNIASGMSATNIQGAINELDSTIDTLSSSSSSHISSTVNPHSVTLSQAIAADTASDPELTIGNINSLINDSNADLLHNHDAAAVSFNPAGTTLSATNVGSAISELFTLTGNGIERGTIFPTSPDGGDIFYRTDLSLLYQYDASRTSWLSITQMFLDWGSSAADGVYLNIHGAAATQTGYLMPRAGKIISITARCASGNLSKTLEIRRNHSTTALKSFTLSSGTYSSITENVEFSAGDYIQAFATSNSVASRDIVVMATIVWS